MTPTDPRAGRTSASGHCIGRVHRRAGRRRDDPTVAGFRRQARSGRLGSEEPLPTLRLGDLALTSTPALDEAGARAQVVRRQPDGTWLRVLDRPDFRG